MSRLLLVASLSVAFAASARAQSFEVVPEFRSFFHASDDGSVLFGRRISTNTFDLYVNGEIVPLGLPPSGVNMVSDQFLRLSGDGDVVSGVRGLNRNTTPYCVSFSTRCTEPFRILWRAGGTLESLPFPADFLGIYSLQGNVASLSTDGTVIVQSYQVRRTTASGSEWNTLRWTDGELELVERTPVGSEGIAVMRASSSTAQVLAGSGITGPSGFIQAVRYDGSPEFLGFRGEALAITPDGTTLVGQEQEFPLVGDFVYAPFRWKGGTAQRLGYVDPAASGRTGTGAISISRDGTVVLGLEETSSSVEYPTLWIEGQGIRRLTDVLKDDYGLDLSAFDLDPSISFPFTARYMSPDLVIVGEGTLAGTSPAQVVAWRAVLTPTFAFQSPVGDEIVPPGKTYEIRFLAPGLSAVDLYLVANALDPDGPRALIAEDVPTADGVFEWDVPEDLLSPSTFLIAVNADDPERESQSAPFRVRFPNRLHRVIGTVANPEYERARTPDHVWVFSQDGPNIWPADYWERSERYYEGFPLYGSDPFYAEPDVRYLPLGFPDIQNYWYTPWTAWVDAFGTDATYSTLEPLFVPGFAALANQPDLGAFEAWREAVVPGYGETVGEAADDSYRGVCFGLSNAMLAAFAEPDAFTARWLPSLNGGTVGSVPLSDEVRDVAHALQNRTRDVRFSASRDRQQTYDPATPQSVLEEIKRMLARDERDLDRSVWFSGRMTGTDSNGDPLTGAHAVAPLALEDEGVFESVDAGEKGDGLYAFIFYDPNVGKGRVGVMRIDSTGNAWGPYMDWSGETGTGFYTGPFVRDVFSEGQPPWQPSASPSLNSPAFAGGLDLISVDVLGRSSAVIASNGDAIAFERGVVTETLANSTIRFPITGAPGRPEGYRVPRGTYRAEVTPDDGGQARLAVDWGRLRLAVERTDGTAEARDRIDLDPEGGVALTSAGGRVAFRALATVGEGDARLFRADGLAAAAGTGAHLRMTADSTAFALGGLAEDQAYDLSLATSTASGTRAFYHADVALPVGATHTVRPDWDTLGEGDVTIDVDLDGDGDTDETILLGNEGLPVASEDAGPGPAAAFALTVYPNPASRAMTVEVEMPEATVARVLVFDVLGRRVATLHDGPLAGGAHTFALDASILTPGVYMVRVGTPDGGVGRALTVVR